MKLRYLLLCALPFLALAAGQRAYSQAILASPAFIDYQGKVLDSTGNPLAPSTPTNYQVIFRIYSAQTGGTSLWTEQQTATISNGLFSVQLGSGTQYLAEPHGNLSTTAFQNSQATSTSTRYVGVTVVIPPATPATAGEITPRLAVLTSPFSYCADHAATADSVTGVVNATSGSTFSGVITAGAGSTFAGTVNAATGSTFAGTVNAVAGSTFAGTVNAAAGSTFASGTLSGTLTGGAFAGTHTGNGSGLTALSGANITAGSVPDTALSSNVTLDNKSQTFSGNNNFTGSNAVSSSFYLNGGTFGLNGGQLVIGSNGDPKNFVQYGGNVGGSGFSGVALCGWLGGQLGYYSGSPFQPVLTWNTSSYVGIGTTNPGYPLDVAGSVGFNDAGQQFGYVDNVSISNSSGDYSSRPVSIHCAQSMLAMQYLAVSDVRAKVIDGFSDGAADLATLSAIKITNFHYKDVLQKGSGPHKKVIAQQVEQVFPQAVSKGKDVVPDIYQKAAIDGEWIILATDLKVGEKVRLIDRETQELAEVLETKADRFRTSFKSKGKEVFVYGREVKDCRSVDYEAISMLNVSATQQIKKEKDAEIRALKEENAALQQKLAALEAKQSARLAKLEQALARLAAGDSSAKPAPAGDAAPVPAILSAER